MSVVTPWRPKRADSRVLTAAKFFAVWTGALVGSWLILIGLTYATLSLLFGGGR